MELFDILALETHILELCPDILSFQWFVSEILQFFSIGEFPLKVHH